METRPLWRLAGNRRFISFLLAASLLTFLTMAGWHTAGSNGRVEHYDIVIYGGSFAGCAAARTAAQAAPEKSILLVVPDPAPALGSIGTTGGQNFFDLRHWRGQLVTGGSFARWYSQMGQFYHTGAMASLLRADLAQHDNIFILWTHDIEEVRTATKPERIHKLILREVSPDENGVARWSSNIRQVKGQVFVDASDDGRLVRLAGLATTGGRYDWPAEYLEQAERDDLPKTRIHFPRNLARQQAAHPDV